MDNQEIGFTSKIEAVGAIVRTAMSLGVTSREEHAAAGNVVAQLREIEKELDAEYQSLPIVKKAKELQSIRVELGKAIENARKAGKKAMLDFEDRLEAERMRAEREAQEAARKLAEEATLQDALEAESLGNKEQAEAILSEPVVAAVVVVPEEKLKAKGHTRRRVYRIKITDASRIPADYLIPDVSKLEATARAWKREGEIIPGVQCFSEVV